MSREKIIKQLKKTNPALNNSQLIEILDLFCENIKKSLKNNKKVELRGFGTFFIKKIKEKHSARNPKTGKLLYVPKKNKIRFKTSKKLNKIINE